MQRGETIAAGGGRRAGVLNECLVGLIILALGQARRTSDFPIATRNADRALVAFTYAPRRTAGNAGL